MAKIKKESKRSIKKKIRDIEKKDKKRIKEEKKIASKKAKEIKKGKRIVGEIDVRRRKKEEVSPARKKLLIILSVILFALISVTFALLSWYVVLISLVGVIALGLFYFIIKKRLKKYEDIKKMEDAFPDFIALMAANLRAGLTVDKAMLMSIRKEFAPLDKEISALGKDIITGKDINKALLEMAERIKSEDIRKTIMLIVSGIKSGGNLTILLEQVSSNMRASAFVKKRAASNVLMYVIFIVFAVSIGAPILFSLSSVLVGVLTGIISNLPADQATAVQVPFVLSSVSISVNFIIYYSIIFIISTDILSALVLGLVSKGKEREGLKFIVPMIFFSLIVFFVVRLLLFQLFPDFF